MSKKRRKKQQTQKGPSSEARPVQPSAKTKTGSVHRAGEFEPDYGYVVKDLKRIAILAGSFLVILIVLSFVFR